MSLFQKPVSIRSIFAKRWVRLTAIVAGGLLLVWAIASFLVFPVLMDSVLVSLNARLNSASSDSSLSVGGIEPFRGHEIVLKDLQFSTPARKVLTIPRVRLGFSLFEVIAGRRIPDYVVVEDMALVIDTDVEDWGGLKPLKDRIDGMTGGADGVADATGAGPDASRHRSVPDVTLKNSSVSLINKDSAETIVSLSDIDIDVEYQDFEEDQSPEASWNIEGDMDLQGLQTVDGGNEAELEVSGRIALDGGFSLKVGSRVPFYAPASRRIPAVMSLGSFDVRMDPAAGRLSASLGELSLSGVGQFVDKISHGRFQIEGELGMDSAAVEVRLDSIRHLPDVKVEDLTALSAAGARFTARFKDGRTFSARDVGLTMTPISRDASAPAPAAPVQPQDSAAAAAGTAHARRNQPAVDKHVEPPVDVEPYWVIDFSGLAGSDEQGFSAISLAGRFSKSMTFVDGHLKTDGPLPIVILSMIHDRFLTWGDPSLGLDVDVSHDGQFWRMKGRAEGRNLSYFLPRLCLVPILGVSFDTDFELIASMSEKVINAQVKSFRTGRMELSASFEYEFMHAQPSVKAQLTIPRQPCQNVFDAIPPAMVPRLRGAKAAGDMSFGIRFEATPGKQSVLKIEPDLESCRVLTLGDSVDLAALMSDNFIHKVVEEDTDGQPVVILTGPGSRSFVPLKDIPVHVQQAALATEDMNFFKHQGFAPGLIKRAILLNMDKGWYVYGGSTITQQLVKNLFLSREKTMSRKLEEAIIVWALEREIPKEKTLELYLNCIEFGMNLYGIKAAASTYFNKTPMELTPLESAFIMATKPSPKSAYFTYEKKVMGKWWVERLEGILKRLWGEMGQISERDYVDAEPWIPTFWYGDEGIYQKPEIVGVPDVPTREALGLPPRTDDGQQLPTVRLEPGPGAADAPAGVNGNGGVDWRGDRLMNRDDDGADDDGRDDNWEQRQKEDREWRLQERNTPTTTE